MDSSSSDIPRDDSEVSDYLAFEEQVPLHDVVPAGIRLNVCLPQGTGRCRDK